MSSRLNLRRGAKAVDAPAVEKPPSATFRKLEEAKPYVHVPPPAPKPQFIGMDLGAVSDATVMVNFNVSPEYLPGGTGYPLQTQRTYVYRIAYGERDSLGKACFDEGVRKLLEENERNIRARIDSGRYYHGPYSVRVLGISTRTMFLVTGIGIGVHYTALLVEVDPRGTDIRIIDRQHGPDAEVLVGRVILRQFGI